MDKDSEIRTVACIYDLMESAFNGVERKWFISFGTLLHFIRDMNMGKELCGDFDISVMGEGFNFERCIDNAKHFSFHEKHRISDDKGVPLFSSLRNNNYKTTIDVFRWVQVGDMMYHTYDERLENPPGGIPSTYLFKGTPAHLFDGDLYRYVWDGRCQKLNFPKQYGALLDAWYPGWIIPDRNFGTSKCVQEIHCKKYSDLKEAHHG
jgi:hypothetical protein